MFRAKKAIEYHDILKRIINVADYDSYRAVTIYNEPGEASLYTLIFMKLNTEDDPKHGIIFTRSCSEDEGCSEEKDENFRYLDESDSEYYDLQDWLYSYIDNNTAKYNGYSALRYRFGHSVLVYNRNNKVIFFHTYDKDDDQLNDIYKWLKEFVDGKAPEILEVMERMKDKKER